jgi:hypothetical protein
MGGVMVAIGGIGNILMLSSASAPSRVPHVVWSQSLVMKKGAKGCGAGCVPLSL